jgi:hypothetical protein
MKNMEESQDMENAKKGRMNCEKIRKIWKKSRLNRENMENVEEK